MPNYKYDIEIKCGKGLVYPHMGYHFSSTIRPPDNQSIQRQIDRAKEITSSEWTCVGCTIACELRNLAAADLDTVKSVLFNLPVTSGELPTQT